MRRFLIFSGITLVAAGGAFALSGGPRFATPRLVDIPPRTPRRTIATELQEVGAVRSAAAFSAWCLLHPRATLKAGTYRFEGMESAPAAFAQMAGGNTFTVTLVVPEGYSRFDIAREVESRGLGTAAAFLKASSDPGPVRDLDPIAPSTEGYLFPATYHFSPHASATEMVAAMVQDFRQTMHRNPGLGPVSLAERHAWVTLASLVERETPAAAERPVIAGVFENRLARGWKLECDPTVVYAALLAGRYAGAIHRSDLEFNSAYNTYSRAGLPPGPIANPGLEALRAAAHPASTPYMFFVADGHGQHRFARTRAEHEANVRRYLQSKQAKPGA